MKSKLFIAACILLLVFLIAGWDCRDAATDDRIDPVEAAEAAPVPDPNLEYVLQPGDTLFDTLVRLNITPADVDRLVNAGREAYDLGRVRDGRRIEYRLNADGQLEYFRYDIDAEKYFEAEKTVDGYRAEVVEIPFTMSLVPLHLTLTNCLYCDADTESWDPNVLWQLADNIFAWTVDFYTDIREGDEFWALVECKQLETGAKVWGKVAGAAALVDNEFQAGVWQETGEQGDYYDLAGRSMRRPFLRSPLKYNRISSGFTYNRRHPILKTVRPHLGVDFAAPSGTPVRAAADGTVIFKGRNGGFGNFLKLRHAGRYETWYGHLKSYARGLKKGQKVAQGQVIGYVGSTGLSTGPHLDYRMSHQGKMVNPLKQKYLPGKPLPKEYGDQFRAQARGLLETLDVPQKRWAELLKDPEAESAKTTDGSEKDKG